MFRTALLPKIRGNKSLQEHFFNIYIRLLEDSSDAGVTYFDMVIRNGSQLYSNARITSAEY